LLARVLRAARRAGAGLARPCCIAARRDCATGTRSVAIISSTGCVRGATQVASSIGDVNRGAGETRSASAQVLASARSLSQESNHLREEVDRFLATVRAA